MNVKRTELLRVLKQCLPGIENGNTVLEGADLFIFHNGCVHSYNDIISVTVPVRSEGLLNEGIEGAVKAEEFFSIISKFSGDLIEFAVADDKWILKSGRAKVELTLMAVDFTERFDIISPNKKNWLEIPPEFTQGLGVCRMTNNKSAISGVFVTSKDILSSDGFQANRFKYNGADFKNFWISDASAGELLKVGVLTHIQIKDSWAHFKTADNIVFSIKTLQVEQWPYDKVIEILDALKKTKTSISAIFPKELFDAIDRASSFYLDISDMRAVRLLISPKQITVSAERIAGKYEEKVAWKDAPPEFPAFELYVNPQMILFAARRSMSFYIHEVENDAPRMIFTTENSMHLMVTLSIDDVEETEVKEKLEKKSVKAENKNSEKSGKRKSNVPAMYEDEEEEEEDKPSRKPPAKPKRKPVEDDDEEEEDEEEEELDIRGENEEVDEDDD
jgi:hypothetical protein